MRLLVTGAAGLLGSRVVRQLLDRGHAVRAVIRPTHQALPADWRSRAEIVRADLLTTPELHNLFDGVDVIIHLAAAMRGTADDQLASAKVGTERLLNAMRIAESTAHIVLAGSCSVYDYTATSRILNEDSPLETKAVDIDGYTNAKIMQERVTRHFAEERQWTLSVLRPAFIYGPGAGPAAVAGLALGRFFLVFAPFSHLRLTHVENCASAFVNAAEKRIAGTFNIIDDDRVTAWRYAGKLKCRERSYLRIPIPYYAGLAMAYLARVVYRALLSFGGRKLPGIFNPCQYRARFKPLKYVNRRAKEGLAWKCPPLFDTECDVT